MKAILLCAGEGSRLRPHTLDKPKCLVEIGNQSLLAHQLSILKQAHIADISIVTGYKKEQLDEYSSKTFHNAEYASTNMVWSLFCAREEINDEVIISYGDIVYSLDALKTLIQDKSPVSVIVDKNWKSYWTERHGDPMIDSESLKVNKDNHIVSIGQKPGSLDEIEGQYIGLIKFSKEGAQMMKDLFDQCVSSNKMCGKSPRNAYMTDFLQEASQSIPIHAAWIHGDWIEIDSCDDLNADCTKKRLSAITKLTNQDYALGLEENL